MPESDHTISTSKSTLGFWLYLMSDSLLFAALFATYAVLKNNVAGGVSSSDIFSTHYALIETIILLTSSYTCGIALLSARTQNIARVKILLGATLLLGLAFLAMEVSEFSHLIHEGHTATKSAFLSAFFTLVGAHGLHICVGILWASVMLVIVRRRGLTAYTSQKLHLFGMYWHFLDIIWIFIFTFVYILGGPR